MIKGKSFEVMNKKRINVAIIRENLLMFLITTIV
jgi:hypothetical protein